MAINGKTRFTVEEWKALANAEEPIFHEQEGIFAYTDVNFVGDDHPLLAAMWEHAAEYVEQDFVASGEFVPSAEVARRVALANALLAFGPEFIAEHVEDAA